MMKLDGFNIPMFDHHTYEYSHDRHNLSSIIYDTTYLSFYSFSAPHLHTKMSWNKIKDNEIHLDPATLPDLSIPAFDWLREYHRDEL